MTQYVKKVSFRSVADRNQTKFSPIIGTFCPRRGHFSLHREKQTIAHLFS